MPNARRSKAVALLLLGVMVGWTLVSTANASAYPTEPLAPAPAAPGSSPLVSIDDDSEVASSSPPQNPMNKISPDLLQAQDGPDKTGLVSVLIYTDDVPALGRELAQLGARRVALVDGEVREVAFAARPWGQVGAPTSLYVSLPRFALVDVAALPSVLYVDVPQLASTTTVNDPVFQEERMGYQDFVARIRAGAKDSRGMGTLGGSGFGVSPTSWAIAREHKAYDAWQIDLDPGPGSTYAMGGGVNVAVIDTGEDFGHPSLNGRWATAPTGSAWEGWPIMFHPASMEGLFGAGWWTATEDFNRLPLPFWLAVNDGDVWYSNTDYVSNDTTGTGILRYAHGTANPFTGVPQYTPFVNPQAYGSTCGGANNNRITRNYIIGAPGDPWQIRSASGEYHLGVNRDDTLTGLNCGKVGILVVDSTAAYVYDTVYVDLNFDFNFTNDKPVSKADPIANADLTGDGIPDISGGLLYFIANSNRVAGESIVTGATGAETGADMAKWWDFDGDGTDESTAVAVDMSGARFTWDQPLVAMLEPPGGGPLYDLPSSTEDIYEEFTGGPVDETGSFWGLGGPLSTYGPVNFVNFYAYSGLDTILRGPGPDFSVSVIWEVGDYSGNIWTEDVDYAIDMATGQITWLQDVPDTETVYIIYQLATYVLEPVSGRLTFMDVYTQAATALPAGWNLLGSYWTGLPIPYSQVYGPAHGYDTFIPAQGDLVAFHGDFDSGQSHGSFVSSTIAARPFGNLAATEFEVFGTAPDAKIIGIAACCNAPGPLFLFGDILDQETFAAVGYDGVPMSGDEAQIASNSWGFTDTLNTGMSFFDRWMIDHWNRYPGLTTLIALGNNGPGYGTSSPGGSSPGVIGVGAGTSGDYRILYGFDGGDGYWELPDCTLAGSPPDPRLCTGIGPRPGPYGDHIFFSSRGPTLIGQPKPDIVSIGGYGVEAGPLNVFGAVPADLDGNFAFDIFSGTSQATPVTSGVSALIAQAYKAAHGSFPTNNMLKELLKSSADDMHRDILQQGAGWTNALRGVEAALDSAAYTGVGDGITSSVDHWRPGGYEGVSRQGFVNFLEPGSSDAIDVTLTSRNPSVLKTVNVMDAVYQRATAPYRFSFSLGTGSNQFVILKADGLYDITGATKLDPASDFRPYWNTADFVKVTFTYDAVAFTAGTSWRLDTFDWLDSNGNGVFDQTAFGLYAFWERSRMTVAVNGANANSVWETIHSPGTRIDDGWALNPRGGQAAASGPLPATIIVEFYEKADWPWVDVTPTSFTMAALSTRTVTVTATVPLGTPAGMYQGAVYVTDEAGDTTTIPIVITVPLTGFPVYLGGSAPATSLYENSGVVQGARSGWRQIGDTRYIWTNFTVAANVDRSRRVIYNAMLTGPKSDLEMYVFSLTPDATWTDSAIYGPGTMEIPCNVFNKLPAPGSCGKRMNTRESVGGTDTLYPNREFMFSDPKPLDDVTTRITPINGLQVFQIKAWSASADTETLSANIGIMDTTPIAFGISTNRLAGNVPVGVSANVPLWDGLGAAATDSIVTPIGAPALNLAPNPPGPDFNAWMCGQRAPNEIVLPPVGAVISRIVTVHILAPPPTDHDLQIWLDINGNNVCDNGVDQLLCQSADADADEECTATTSDGTKAILIQIGPYSGGLVTDVSGTDTRLFIAVSPIGLALAAPTTDVAANTPVIGGIAWNAPGNTAPGTQAGKLFISPGYARFALAQETSITWTYDLTPPSITRATDLSPAPDSVIRASDASVVANIFDSTGRLDRFSVQLIVDGVDVTAVSRISAPYSNGYGISPVTIAWEHPDYAFSDGPHSAVVNARDLAGNLRSEVWMWTVDTTGPSVAISSPASDVVTNQATWAFAAQTDPGATVTVAVNGAVQAATVNPDGLVTAVLDIGADGTYVVELMAADALGNENTVSRTILRDGTAPVVSAGADASSPTNRLSTRITGTVNEGVTDVCVSAGGASVGCTVVAADGTFSIVVPLSEGTNTFVLQTTDAAGNTGSVTLPGIERDTAAPSIAIDTLPPVVTNINQGTVTVSGSVTPATGLWFVSVNGQDATVRVNNVPTGAFSADFPLAVGDNTFVVQATDLAGNVAQDSVSVAFSPVVTRDVPNYNSVIASGVAVVLLIVGFVVGYLLSARGGAPPMEPPAMAPPKMEARAEEELPREEPKKAEEEEL